MTQRSDAARRDEAIRAAVSAADAVIMREAQGPDEQDYLTIAVAAAFVDKAKIPAAMRLLRAEYGSGSV